MDKPVIKLNARQQAVLDFMRQFYNDNDQLPTMRCIATRFGWKSGNAAQCYCDILEQRGHIERNVLGKYRFARAAGGAQVNAPTWLPMLKLPMVDQQAANAAILRTPVGAQQ